MPAFKDFDRFLAGHPVFTVGEAALFLGAVGAHSRQRVNLLLAYHAKVGHIKRVRRAKSIDEAVQTAQSLAQRGDVVLLSPACASFDWFENYEQRGRVFKELVKNL